MSDLHFEAKPLLSHNPRVPAASLPLHLLGRDTHLPSSNECRAYLDYRRRFSDEEKSALTKICPDFVIELRSLSDRLPYLEAKMEEYIANGVRLAWLLDPIANRATIYKPGQTAERIDNPTIISGDPVLPGLRFDFREIL